MCVCAFAIEKPVILGRVAMNMHELYEIIEKCHDKSSQKEQDEVSRLCVRLCVFVCSPCGSGIVLQAILGYARKQ